MIRTVQFLEENAAVLVSMVVAGFAIMYLADAGALEDKAERDEFLVLVRHLRAGVSRDRAFLVLDALNELPVDAAQRAKLKQFTDAMRTAAW